MSCNLVWKQILQRRGVPDRCMELIKIVIDMCPHCNAFKPVPRRPRFGADLAGHFGDRMIIDLLFLWGLTFLLMIDEAIRFKVAAHLEARDPKSIGKAMLHSWFRYFGPPKCLTSDQEGGVKAEEFGIVCDRFSIHRQLAGSDNAGKHTTTGLAERHVQLVKLSSLKCEHQCRTQGLDIDKEDIVAECAMGQTFQLEYGGFTPAQGLMGHNPRGLYEVGSSSVVVHACGATSSPDYFEQYMRMGLLAKVAIQQAIIEQRLSDANNSKPMKIDLSKLRPMQDQVDLYRVPDKTRTTPAGAAPVSFLIFRHQTIRRL